MNTCIRAAREAGLAVLKPSQRDLEHGMELHRDALVMESYSLGLHAPIDPAAVNQLIDAGAPGPEIQEEITAMGLTRWVSAPELRREYLEAREAAGVACMYQNAGEEGNIPTRLMRRLACHSYLIDAMPDVLRRVFSPDDIVAAHRDGKFVTCLTTNGVPLAGLQDSVAGELVHLRVFARLGVRMMHLTYNRRNMMGDGCAEPANAGLSDFGRAVVAEMNRWGIMVDLAHTGWQTCLDAAAVSSQPVVVSHSAAWALNPHVRCKPDDVIKAVVDTGGTMGITNVPAFLGGGGNLSALLDHIDYVARKFGTDAVTIGTDDAYRSQGYESAAGRLQPRSGGRPRWENFWPPDDPLLQPAADDGRGQASMTWTNWPLFTVGLVQRGYTDADIRKIIGGNMLRVARAAWEASALAPQSF